MIVRIPLALDRDFAVDELAVVYPILNAIFDPIPIFAEETDSFVRAWIGQPHATRATPSIAHYLEANPAVCGFPFGAKEKFSAHQSITSLIRPFFKSSATPDNLRPSSRSIILYPDAAGWPVSLISPIAR
jgi:hypothetical protein